MGLRRKVDHAVRCDLCHQPTHNPYSLSIEGNLYNFCSGLHARMAGENFKKKQEEGFPASPSSLPQSAEETNVNTEEV